MTRRRVSGASLTGISSLILMYVVAIAVVLVIARRLLSDVSFLGSISGVLLVIFVIVFPLALLILVIINSVHLVKDSVQKKPGSGLRMRFLFANIFILLLAAVPQGVISIGFLAGAMDTWFNEESVQALRGGLSMSIGYYNDQVQRLEDLAGNEVFQRILADAPQQPAQAWANLKSLPLGVDALQLWDANGQEVFHAGDPLLRLAAEQLPTVRLGAVARESLEDVGFIRVILPAGNQSLYRAMAAMRLPTGFYLNAERLTSTLELFAQAERLQPAFIAGVMIFYAAFSVPLLLLALLVSFVLSDEIMRPIESLEEATVRVAEGDYSYRILSRSRGDISHLVDSFNAMIQELDSSRKKIRQTEKVAAWQEIAQRLAHEIKNPLTPIQLSAERLLQKYRQGADDFESILQRSVSSIVREVEGLSAMLGEFRSFSSLPKPKIQRFELKPLIQELCDLYQHETQMQFHFSQIQDGFSIDADRDMFKRILVNMWSNAIEAMGKSGEIMMRADVVQKGRSRYARIQITDNGPGIAEDFAAQVFHPYFTTKDHGTGLGLAIVERIVFDHDGAVWLETEPGDGTTFYLDFPVRD